MSNLRNKLIRLAHEKPALRPDLLPLIREAWGRKPLTPPDPIDTPSLTMLLRFSFEGGGMNWDYPEFKRYGGEAVVAAQLLNELADDNPHRVLRHADLLLKVDRKEYRYDQRNHRLTLYVDVFGPMDSYREDSVVSAVEDTVVREIEKQVKYDGSRRYENLVYGMVEGQGGPVEADKVEVL